MIRPEHRTSHLATFFRHLRRSITWLCSTYRGRHGLCKFQKHREHFQSPLRLLFLETIGQSDLHQILHPSRLHPFVQVSSSTLLEGHQSMVKPGQLSHPVRFIKSNERKELQRLRYFHRFRRVMHKPMTVYAGRKLQRPPASTASSRLIRGLSRSAGVT